MMKALVTDTQIEFERPTRLLGAPATAHATVWATGRVTHVVIKVNGERRYEAVKSGSHVTLGARYANELCKRGFTARCVFEKFEAAIWVVPFKDDEIPFNDQPGAVETTDINEIPW
jgi:hypothetical protein